MAFMEGCASVYLWYPNILRIDQEASFTLAHLLDAATVYDIKLRISGTYSHILTGAGERYNAQHQKSTPSPAPATLPDTRTRPCATSSILSIKPSVLKALSLSASIRHRFDLPRRQKNFKNQSDLLTVL